MAYTLLDSVYQRHNSPAEFAALGGRKTGLLRRTGRFLRRNKGKLAIAGLAGLGLAAAANRGKIEGGIRRTADRYRSAGLEARRSLRREKRRSEGNDPFTGKPKARVGEITSKAYAQADRRGRINEAKKDVRLAASKIKSFNPFTKKK